MRGLVLGAAAAALLSPLVSSSAVAAGSDVRPAYQVDGAFLRVADQKGAENFVGSMAGRAIGFLGDASLSQQQKRASFRKLLEDSFDMATIGRFALGTYWRSASEAQRVEYQKQFKVMVVNVYSERFTEYTNQTFRTTGSRPDGEKDVIVSSVIESPEGKPPVKVDWRVRNKDGRYKIVDVMVEGVSMSLTQRSDFSSVIQAGGGNVQILLDHLKQRNG
ncbi:MlaC/ttg2D family ABC transporter substrate-binding protein [Micavibrio aeruginosavorus]|uniref:MlaC/ttg2D family ABC transporter substrate-binding protein n=1 Tax=Micavibrio aeruginosavorus TaxID=349221 RepID=UPI003F4AF191